MHGGPMRYARPKRTAQAQFWNDEVSAAPLLDPTGLPGVILTTDAALACLPHGAMRTWWGDQRTTQSRTVTYSQIAGCFAVEATSKDIQGTFVDFSRP